MTPREYEFHAGEEYRRRGYKVEMQPGVSDWGVDLFATKGAEKIAVQVKMYGGTKRPVTRAMVMELEGVRRYFDCSGAAIVTNGRVLSDADKVAAKLAIPIVRLEADTATAPVVPAQNGPHFDEIWANHIIPLAGRTLSSTRGGDNQIVKVDWSGVERITSRGERATINIEIFKTVVNRLLEVGAMTRDQINELYVGRASSGVALILSQVPYFEYGGKPATLSYRPPNQSPPE